MSTSALVTHGLMRGAKSYDQVWCNVPISVVALSSAEEVGVTGSRWTITVPGHPPGLNDRLHWRARRRLEQPFRESVGWQAKAFGLPEPLARARVVVTFVYHGRRHAQDTDNLYARCKCLVDALRGIVIVDDSPRHVELEVRQQLGRERSVRIEISPTVA